MDGMDLGSNTKAAVIRIGESIYIATHSRLSYAFILTGLVEMMSVIKRMYSKTREDTFFHSCGVADLITTCYGGRNRRVSEAFVRTGKPLAELEAEMLNGQKLQGPATAQLLHQILETDGFIYKVPLFLKVYKIFFEGAQPASLLDVFSISSNL